MAHDLEIRLLAADDLESAHALSSTIGWNQRLEDWRMLTSLAPAGSFGAVDGGRIVGTAIGIDYDTFGWVAMMLVDPAYRGRGLGAQLLELALSALPADLPVRLDATPLGRPLYERYGFAMETTLTRYLRPRGQPWTGTGSGRGQPSPRSGAVPGQPRTAAGSAGGQPSPRSGAVPGQPRTAAGSAGGQPGVSPGPGPGAGPGLAPNSRNRARLLQWMQANAPEYAFAGDVDDVPQYCLGRHGRLFDQIGPVVAQSAEAAITLAGAALSNAGSEVIVDAYDAHQPFTAWLRSAGFEPQRPLYRMCRGTWTAPAHQGGLTEFAILGPEFG